MGFLNLKKTRQGCFNIDDRFLSKVSGKGRKQYSLIVFFAVVVQCVQFSEQLHYLPVVWIGLSLFMPRVPASFPVMSIETGLILMELWGWMDVRTMHGKCAFSLGWVLKQRSRGNIHTGRNFPSLVAEELEASIHGVPTTRSIIWKFS